jgi:hypothetical protein
MPRFPSPGEVRSSGCIGVIGADCALRPRAAAPGQGTQYAAGARAGLGSLGDPEAIGAWADHRARGRRTSSRPVTRRVHLAGPPSTPSSPKRRGRGESSSSRSIAGRPWTSLDRDLSDARRKKATGRARHGRPHPHCGKPPGVVATVSSLSRRLSGVRCERTRPTTKDRSCPIPAVPPYERVPCRFQCACA